MIGEKKHRFIRTSIKNNRQGQHPGPQAKCREPVSDKLIARGALPELNSGSKPVSSELVHDGEESDLDATRVPADKAYKQDDSRAAQSA